MKYRYLSLLVTACWACSSEPLPSGHYVITTGQETDTYTMDPVPSKYTTYSLSSTTSNATLTELATSDKPIDSIEVPPTGVNWYSLQATDADGVIRVEANSLALSGIGMAGYNYPLFAGRTDAFCRPPGALVTAQGDHPPLGLIWGRYIWAVGGGTTSAIASDSYDLVSWGEASPQTYSNDFTSLSCNNELPCQYLSFATYAVYDSSTGEFVDQFGLGIGSAWASAIDIGAGTTTPVNVPTGLSSWSDIAGGRTYYAPSGAVYIVGPTRSTAESSAVLEIGTDTNLHPFALGAARLKAAATYIEGQGLVVIGGSATAPGVEVLADDSDKFTALDFPPDEVQGAALLQEKLSSSVVWRVGGRKSDGTPAPSVAYDLSCTGIGSDTGDAGAAGGGCQPTPLTGRDIDVAMATGYGYDVFHVVVGEQDDGTMVAWRVTDTDATLIPQREPRMAASVIDLPNRFVALVGGRLVSDNSAAMNLELVAY